MFKPGSYLVPLRQFRHLNLKGGSKSAARPDLFRISQLDRGIKMQKYVSSRILPDL